MNSELTNTINAYLQRGFIALNDEEWEDADPFFESVLNMDPTNALVYVGKTLIMEQCRSLDAFLVKRKKATIDAKADIFTLEPCHSHIDEMVQKYSLGMISGNPRLFNCRDESVQL